MDNNFSIKSREHFKRRIASKRVQIKWLFFHQMAGFGDNVLDANEVEQIEDVEEWHVIGGFERYSVSNLGNVRNDVTQRILRPSISANGYYTVSLWNNGRGTTKSVDRLEATAFLGDSEGREINHKDINKLNNHISNLEYCTHSENQQNKLSYCGRRSEYVATLTADAVPYTRHNGFALQSGYWRDGHNYYRKVANGFRKVAAVPDHRKIHIQLTFEDGRKCNIRFDA
jgi:hypothetical protein